VREIPKTLGMPPRPVQRKVIARRSLPFREALVMVSIRIRPKVPHNPLAGCRCLLAARPASAARFAAEYFTSSAGGAAAAAGPDAEEAGGKERRSCRFTQLSGRIPCLRPSIPCLRPSIPCLRPGDHGG